MTDQQDVRPGQVWADNDPRHEGRTVRVDALQNIYRFGRSDPVLCAYCTVLTNVGGAKAKSARTVTIRVSRMRPTSTGYRLVTDAQEG